MFLRCTYLYFAPKTQSEAKKIFLTEIAPAIRKQKGNRQVWLLEPADDSGEYISYSLWENESDIRRFEASAEYTNIIGKVQTMVTKAPEQKYYVVNQ